MFVQQRVKPQNQLNSNLFQNKRYQPQLRIPRESTRTSLFATGNETIGKYLQRMTYANSQSQERPIAVE